MFDSSFWRIIHYFAMHNIGSNDFYTSLRFFLSKKMLDCWEDPKEGEDLTDWSIRIHNKYNKNEGKYDTWTREDCIIANPMMCDFKAGKSTPWNILHYIAVRKSGEALRFLQLFNNLYPDEECRGRFFVDNPVGMKETLYEWAIRNHKRMNLEFKFDIDHGVIYSSKIVSDIIPNSEYAPYYPPMPEPFELIKPNIPITPPEVVTSSLVSETLPTSDTTVPSLTPSFASLRFDHRY